MFPKQNGQRLKIGLRDRLAALNESSSERVSQARNPGAVEVALAVRSDLDATTDALAILTRVTAERAHRTRQLADVTRALPDSAFLVSIRLETDGRGTLAGYAPRVAQVLARLERAGANAIE
jgi:hypothetical protein